MIASQNNMSSIKRQRNNSQSSDVQIKIMRTTSDGHFTSTSRNSSITCLEDLSNELFYDIFDYLDACDIHKAFSSLNIRLENLLTSSLLPLKINLNSKSKQTLEHRCREIIIPNKHRIFSLHINDHSLITTFFNQCNIDSSFHRLESITLTGVSNCKLLMILFYLNSLPRLFSLTVEPEEDFYYSIGDIYRIVLCLPFLKYFKLSLSDYEETDITVPVPINNKSSTIEHLVVDHQSTLNELSYILYHTPQLRHLSCKRLVEPDDVPTKEVLLTLPNLTHISITDCSIEFDRFEIFIKNISSQLQMLRLHTFLHSAYLDGNRWKRLIKKYMPSLCKFHFDHHAHVDEDHGYTPKHEAISEFTSVYWIERKWFFELKDDSDGLVYSIQPYRKTDYPSIPPIRLTIEGYAADTWDQPFIDEMKPTFLAVQFTDLKIYCDGIPVDMLIEIIRLLPNLISLEISSLPVFHVNCLSFEDAEILLLSSISSKITRVKLDKMDELDQIHFLANLCSRMQYLEVGCTTEKDIENIVGFISMNNLTVTPYLCCLCLGVPNANEKIAQNLNMLIDYERLFHVDSAFRDYKIRRVSDKIFLEWKLC